MRSFFAMCSIQSRSRPPSSSIELSQAHLSKVLRVLTLVWTTPPPTMSFSHPKSVEDLLTFRINRLMASAGALVTRLCEGRYGITRREWRLICLLAEQGAMSPSELAVRSHLPRGPVSKHIRDLADKRLLIKRPVAGDMRRARLELTAEGRRIHAQLFPQSEHFHRQVLQALTPAELTAFDSALSRLTEATDRLLAAQPPVAKADRRHGGSRRVPAS